MESASSTQRQRTRRISKVQRWLDLVLLLLSRRAPVTADEILRTVASYAELWASPDERARSSARRSFERDKEELRALGIAIETIPDAVPVDGEVRDGYRIRGRDFYLPVLGLVASADDPQGAVRGLWPVGGVEVELSVEEARLAVEGLRRVISLPGHVLRREAASALRKLTFDLHRVFASVPVYVARRSKGVADPATLHTLLDASQGRRRVRFRYSGIARGKATARRVAPYSLLFQGGRWYLVGHDAKRDDVRVFRVSRIEALELATNSPEPEYAVPDDFDPSNYLGRNAWELSGEEPPVVARVVFDPAAALHCERVGAGELVETRDDRSVVRDFRVDDQAAFVRWLIVFQGAARLTAPDSLKTKLEETARRVARMHADPSEPRAPTRAGEDSLTPDVP